MKVLRERWYVYEIDNKGMLNTPMWARGDTVFSRYGYHTEQGAMSDIIEKSDTYPGEVMIIKTYQAVEKEDT